MWRTTSDKLWSMGVHIQQKEQNFGKIGLQSSTKRQMYYIYPQQLDTFGFVCMDVCKKFPLRIEKFVILKHTQKIKALEYSEKREQTNWLRSTGYCYFIYNYLGTSIVNMRNISLQYSSDTNELIIQYLTSNL